MILYQMLYCIGIILRETQQRSGRQSGTIGRLAFCPFMVPLRLFVSKCKGQNVTGRLRMQTAQHIAMFVQHSLCFFPCQCFGRQRMPRRSFRIDLLAMPVLVPVQQGFPDAFKNRLRFSDDLLDQRQGAIEIVGLNVNDDLHILTLRWLGVSSDLPGVRIPFH